MSFELTNESRVARVWWCVAAVLFVAAVGSAVAAIWTGVEW